MGFQHAHHVLEVQTFAIRAACAFDESGDVCAQGRGVGSTQNRFQRTAFAHEHTQNVRKLRAALDAHALNEQPKLIENCRNVVAAALRESRNKT